jgi:DNA ligase-1
MPEKERHDYHATQGNEVSVGQGRKPLSEQSRMLPGIDVSLAGNQDSNTCMIRIASSQQEREERMLHSAYCLRAARILQCGVLLLVLLPCLPVPCRAAEPASPVMLANVYHRGIDLSAYWISEKYDGVRGYWDGKTLRTRGGETVTAPAWFTAGWPEVPMDGELWAGRGGFAVAVSTVRTQVPDDAAWRRMRFMVFDLPAQQGTFDERLPVLLRTVSRIDQPWVQAVKQDKVHDDRTLQALMRKTVREGGEGLMLHRGASLYRAERNDDLLKLKPYDDAEARVIGYTEGKGRHQGRVGALLVESADGRRFRLGAGLSDAQRAAPPAVGTWITYRFRGVNDSGLPRFATFLRVRDDMNLPPLLHTSDPGSKESL